MKPDYSGHPSPASPATSMRLALLAILVSVLIAYANHMVRVGVVSRRDAARFLPDASRPIRFAEAEWDRARNRQLTSSPPGRFVVASSAQAGFFVDWTEEDEAPPARESSRWHELSTGSGLVDTGDDR